MLVLGYAMAGSNHNGIAHVGDFLFVVCHEFARVSNALANFGDNAVPDHRHIDRLVHFVGNNRAEKGAAREFARRRVNEIPTWNRARI